MQNSTDSMQSSTGSVACRTVQTTCSSLQATQHAEQYRQHAVHYRRRSMQNSTDNMQAVHYMLLKEWEKEIVSNSRHLVQNFVNREKGAKVCEWFEEYSM
jgi:hypothetical protein